MAFHPTNEPGMILDRREEIELRLLRTKARQFGFSEGEIQRAESAGSLRALVLQKLNENFLKGAK